MFELKRSPSDSYWKKDSLQSQLEPPTKMALHCLGKWQKKWPQKASSQCPYLR